MDYNRLTVAACYLLNTPLQIERVILGVMLASLSFAIQVARQAGDLLLNQYHRDGRSAAQPLNGLGARLKADHSVVTEADLASDQLITTAVRANFPNDLILSEELQPDLTASWSEDLPAVWVIDPLDGTTNFSLGLPHWGVLIARLEAGWPSLAVLYFPLLDELYATARGLGAFLNEQPIQVERVDDGRKFSFFTCCTRTYRRYQVSIPFKPRILGSSGYSLCSVARGVARVGLDAAPKLWDLAGGWLLVEEAGGVIEPIDSAPFPLQTGVDYSNLSFPVLFANSSATLQKVRLQVQLR